MARKKIAILFGGRSPEYKISLESAYSVVSHIDRGQFEPILLGISPKGEWFYFHGAAEKIADDTWQNPEDCIPAILSPDWSAGGVLVLWDNEVEVIALDAAFPVLHGKNGEDGTVQGILELAGIPIVGCGVLTSALCMDKDRSHKLAHAGTGVPVPAALVLEGLEDEAAAVAWADTVGYPLFVKPVEAGSSFGISKVSEREALPAAIELAFRYDSRVMVEEAISGFEVGCAVLGNQELVVGELDEIELSDGFFDFAEKYTLKTSAIHVPARIPAEKAVEIKAIAQKIYRALGCNVFARVDLFLEPTGRVVFNEVNTIPGFTAHSRFPNMLKAVGISFAQVITRAIELAVGG